MGWLALTTYVYNQISYDWKNNHIVISLNKLSYNIAQPSLENVDGD